MTFAPPDLLDARILVVDSQEAVVSLLERVLRDAGHQRVTTTTNLLDVCAFHQAHCYDLIVLDVSTPGMNGFAVMAELKAGSAEDCVSVLALTTQPGHLLPAVNAGARDCLCKPFELVEVRARIRNLLEITLLHKQIARYRQTIEAIETEWKAERHESETRYQSLFDLAKNWLWEQDEHGKATKISAPVLEILGFSSMAPLREITSLPSRTTASLPA